MTAHETNEAAASQGLGDFTTTHWSVVLAAGDAASPRSQAALEQLCRTYWYPLYAYVRRRGYSPEDAQDLTQEFFARLLAKQWLGMADPERGRFRSFLLAALSHFLDKEWARARCAKRGGGRPPLPFDPADGERWFGREDRDGRSPAEHYERNWALAVLAHVRARLREEYVRDGNAARFDLLEAFLPGETSPLNYAQAATQWGAAESTVRSAVHRLKRRYGELLRREMAHTVANPTEVDEELRHLISVLGR